MLGATERRREVDAETVNAHRLDPEAHYVERKLGDARMDQAQGIAAAAGILIAAAVVRRQPVPTVIVEAAET